MVTQTAVYGDDDWWWWQRLPSADSASPSTWKAACRRSVKQPSCSAPFIRTPIRLRSPGQSI